MRHIPFILMALALASCGGSPATRAEAVYTPIGPVNDRILTEARTEAVIAYDNYEKGNYSKSYESYQIVLTKLYQIDNQEEAALVRHNMANVLIAQKNYRQAEEELNFSLRVNRRLGGDAALRAEHRSEFARREAANLASLGTIHEERGELDLALGNYREACELMEKHDAGKALIARQHNNCGYVLLKQAGRAGEEEQKKAKAEEAAREFRLALEFSRQVNDYPEIGSAFSGVARCQLAVGRPDLALISFTSALNANKAAEAPLAIAASLKDLARTHERVNDTEKAIDCHERALLINNSLKLYDRIRIDLDDLIRLHNAAGNTARVQELRNYRARL